MASDGGLQLVPTRRQAIIWNNDSLVYWPIYASLDINKLNGPYLPGKDTVIFRRRTTNSLLFLPEAGTSIYILYSSQPEDTH